MAVDISLTRSRLEIAVPFFWKIRSIHRVLPPMTSLKPLFLSLAAAFIFSSISKAEEPTYDIVV
ncbi:MAG: hypothetical protein ACK5VX_18050, partial [Akkermansiaceae bacterium]